MYILVNTIIIIIKYT